MAIGLRNKSNGKFSSDKQRSQSSAREIIAWLIVNIKFLDYHRDSEKLKRALVDMHTQDFPLTPPQLSYLDGIYECAIVGYGLLRNENFSKVGRKYDPHRSLKF